MYVALDTKPSGTVRHLPIQRATAVVNGWDSPTKLLLCFAVFSLWLRPLWENPYAVLEEGDFLDGNGGCISAA